MVEPIDLLFGLWTRVGRRKHKFNRIHQVAPVCTVSIVLCFCTNWQNGETQKLHFSLKCCISALPEFNQLLDFVNLFDLRLILTLLYDSLNLVINVFSSGLLGAWFKRKEVESSGSWTVLHAHCTNALFSGFPILQGNAEALDR